MNSRELIIGFDLQDDYSQLTYALNLSDEPESISMDRKEYQFLIPTVIGLDKARDQWVYGKEALELAQEGRAQIVRNLLQVVKSEEEISLYGSLYQGIYLLERYLYKVLMELKAKWPDKTIKQIVITSDEVSSLAVKKIYKVLSHLGLNKDRAEVISHQAAYLAYVLSQEKGIWLNDISLFDFNERNFTYSQISLERRNTPHLAQVKSKDYSDTISKDEIKNLRTSENFDYILENIINDALYKQVISSIYFTGKGFINGIPESTINKVSKGRRIFIGQNLYVKGACYLAQQRLGGSKLDGFVFLLDDTLAYTISISLYDKGKERQVIMAQLGRSIYEDPKFVELILDDEDRISYQVRDKRGRTIIEDFIILDNLPKRPNKTTRIKLSLSVINKSSYKFQVIDKGFGEFYPSSGRTWEKEVVIGG